jgi:hypothetical protein
MRTPARRSLTQGRKDPPPMLDLVLVALGLGLFAVTLAYCSLCDRL